MSESKNDVEVYGITQVSNALVAAKHLSSFLKLNEKGKGYDGYVEIVREPTDKIDDDRGSVYVQVKCRTQKRKSVRQKISFRIDRSYIEFYARHFPLIFFVVYKYEDYSCSIYYRELQKTDLYLLSAEKGERISFDLSLLDKTPSELDDLFLHFLQESKKQEAINPQNRISLVECLSGGYKLHLSTSSFHPNEKSIVERIREGHVVIYGERENIKYNIDTDGLKFRSITLPAECKLSVGNEEFFSEAEVECTGEQSIVSFAKGAIKLITDISTNRIELKYNQPDNLNSLIPFLRFLIELNKTHSCSFFLQKETTVQNFDPLPSELIDYWNKLLRLCLRIKDLLRCFHVECDLNVFGISREEYDIACQIQRSLQNGEEIEIKGHEEKCILAYSDLGQLKFAFIAIKQTSGRYCVFDELGSDIRREVVFIVSGDDRKYFVPIETCFRDTLIWSCTNFNPENYLKTLHTLLEKDPYLAPIINDFDLLGIIEEYDRCKKGTLLELALSINSLLDNYRTNSNEIILSRINYFQIKKRQRALTNEERNELIDILSDLEDNSFKVAVLLLQDRIDKAEELFRSLKKEEQEVFLSYPISVFFPDREKKNKE